jgi:hypothetical protein
MRLQPVVTEVSCMRHLPTRSALRQAYGTAVVALKAKRYCMVVLLLSSKHHARCHMEARTRLISLVS